MAIRERRERERARRHKLIIDTARELAEREGWDAVTTRRLAESVEYSQPVLYSHFAGKDAIVRAVAIQGFGELAKALHAARSAQDDPTEALRAASMAYLDFAEKRPALYDAMFLQQLDIPFGTSETPQELRAGFDELLAALEPVAGDRDLDTLAEVFWSAIHGFATLMLGARLRPDLREARMNLLLDVFIAN
ncbi:TetR family transcriptional regulator [Prauserella marina]|uniref:DNA-binding transcriptional regulator, AcrR family n=1 Tax=Prauserella marina TaxID=530584 RepID=A0A222VIC4_9PSEU|nr:TetR/AcrR family transcriptional regulator [Prauserella marina]ASR33657.1 TetR family transcriptional regulator [Prauserella marina]PWV82202.1 TetR family transcriptional regulator [Prauserella marina]SDD21510.1 DNA-binding transcriptional regulator, AcrR family [Prauserella marina]